MGPRAPGRWPKAMASASSWSPSLISHFLWPPCKPTCSSCVVTALSCGQSSPPSCVSFTHEEGCCCSPHAHPPATLLTSVLCVAFWHWCLPHPNCFLHMDHLFCVSPHACVFPPLSALAWFLVLTLLESTHASMFSLSGVSSPRSLQRCDLCAFLDPKYLLAVFYHLICLEFFCCCF